MLNTAFKSSWLIGPWFTAAAIIVAASMAMGADLSTTALLLALSVAAGIVIGLLALGAPGPSVAQILYSVESRDGRR